MNKTLWLMSLPLYIACCWLLVNTANSHLISGDGNRGLIALVVYLAVGLSAIGFSRVSIYTWRMNNDAIGR
jgi:hypothetical protein